jgi:hypothetical protein
VTYRDGCLDVIMLGPGALLMTWRGKLRVAVDEPIPETVAVAAIGRRLDGLITHRLLQGRDYPILDARFVDGMTVVTASAPSVDIDIAELLEWEHD